MSGVVRRLVEMVEALRVEKVPTEAVRVLTFKEEMVPDCETREEPTSEEKPIWALEFSVLTVMLEAPMLPAMMEEPTREEMVTWFVRVRVEKVAVLMAAEVATREEPTRVEKPI
jgi:hypothetical protein